MKKEFNWEEFKNKKMVVNCKNEEEVNNFLKECELNEIEVRNYTKKFSYETYHSDVCYRCEDNNLYYANQNAVYVGLFLCGSDSYSYFINYYLETK